jgi:tripartite-type tricarboxylate transporter receptor subunit TctC
VTSPLLEKEFHAPFPVLNITGAVGGLAIAKLLSSPADGQTLVLYVASSNALVASGKASWKVSDLEPVARLQKIVSGLFVKQDSPFTDFDQLQKAVKAKPNQLKTAILGKGTLDEVAMKFMAGKGFQTTLVPYGAAGERYSSLLGGHVDILYEQPGDVSQLMAHKQIRPLLIFNETRMSELPNVPTSREKGYEIFLPEFRGVVAKAGTPAPIVKSLSDTFAKIFKSTEMQQFTKTQYMAADSFQPASEFKKFLVHETENLEKLFTKLGMR